MSILKKNSLFLFLSAVVLFSSCEKVFDLPEEKEFISPDLNYRDKVLQPILGRTQLMGGLNSDNSTLPLKFEIVNARFGDGRPVTDLFQTRPVWVWTAAYTGKETSLEEILAKRKLEERPLFEVRQSGEFIMWSSSTNELIPPRAIDSTHFSQNTRFFDLKVSNTGGSVLIKDFELRPWRERPYEPSNDMNYYTGGVAPDPKFPHSTRGRDYIRPYLNSVIGAVSEKDLVSNDDKKDVVVYIRPFSGGNGHKLRIKVLDKDSVAINPARFNETKWEQMLHGFNIEKTDEYVQYDVAYPIPLANIVTPYSNGSRARARLEYSRIGFGGTRTFSNFGVDFAIYREGDWEIVFHFRTENPKFEDE